MAYDKLTDNQIYEDEFAERIDHAGQADQEMPADDTNMSPEADTVQEDDFNESLSDDQWDDDDALEDDSLSEDPSGKQESLVDRAQNKFNELTDRTL